MRRVFEELLRMKARYPAGSESSLVLPGLHLLQAERGFVSAGDAAELARFLGVPPVQVDEVLSFYGMFRRGPVGKWHIEVCRNASCSMVGAERVLARLEERLGIAPGETTPDGRFTLSTVECLASCGTAPMMSVNGTYHERLTPLRIDEILEELD